MWASTPFSSPSVCSSLTPAFVPTKKGDSAVLGCKEAFLGRRRDRMTPKIVSEVVVAEYFATKIYSWIAK